MSARSGADNMLIYRPCVSLPWPPLPSIWPQVLVLSSQWLGYSMRPWRSTQVRCPPFAYGRGFQGLSAIPLMGLYWLLLLKRLVHRRFIGALSVCWSSRRSH
jgi:hypothetical protein